LDPGQASRYRVGAVEKPQGHRPLLARLALTARSNRASDLGEAEVGQCASVDLQSSPFEPAARTPSSWSMLAECVRCWPGHFLRPPARVRWKMRWTLNGPATRSGPWLRQSSWSEEIRPRRWP